MQNPPIIATHRRLRIGFLHPVLGLGGAERWVVDAALALQALGHDVTIFTAAYDAARAFPETHDGSLDVRVRGAFLPATVGGRLQAPCAIARLCWIAGATMAGPERFDVLISDIAPYAMPLLRAWGKVRGGPRPKIVYYCHYPDQLLAPPRHGWYRAYRVPFDQLEGPAMKTADQVLVNSQFTARAAARLGVRPAEVIYPGVNAEAYAKIADLSGDENIILVVSRFDPRKNQALAVNAFARLRALAPDVFERTSLALAGGLDVSRHEDRTTAAEITALIHQHGLDDKVSLHRSPSETERLSLLEQCLCVLHPAPDEHFGIVPVEAMAAGRPVVAVANAGPLETIVDGETGFLCPPNADAFAQALGKLGRDAALRARFGRAGRIRATHFSHRAFGAALEGALAHLFDADA